MSELTRRPLATATVAALAASLLVAPSAGAAPRPDPRSSKASDAPAAAGKADSDGDKISDDLEAAMEDLEPGDRVDVIVQGVSPSRGKKSAPSVEVDHTFTIIKAFSGSVTAGQVNALSRIPSVTRVELNGVSQALDAAGDRDYGVQAARDAADGTLGGSGVGICIIDTGIDPNHEQLSGRIDGWKDWVNGRTQPYDDHGHGTHVSSIAAGDGTGSANAALYGGVARGASLIGAKVLDSSGSGSDANVAAAIEWCAARSDVDVISMSLGSPGGDGSDAGSQASNAAVASGKVVVVAAGNSGDGPGTVNSPGVATDVITVGAGTDYSVPEGQPGHDDGLMLAGFSSRGPTTNPAAPLKPDVVAPGVSVYAAKAGTASSYVGYSGTSMATPFAAGVVALGLEAVSSATPGQVKAALQASAVDAGAPGADNDWGHGLVDARAFIDALRGVSPVTHAPAPDHLLLQGLVPSSGTTELPFEVGTAGEPLGISVRLDGQAKCVAGSGKFCLVYEWSPDLDIELVNPDGQVVAFSRCALEATNNNCGDMGRWETVGVASADAGTWTLRMVPFSGSPNNGLGGSFEADVFGALGSAPALALTPPTKVAGTPGPAVDEVSLTWDPSVADGVPAVTGYEVQMSPSTGTPVWTDAGTVPDPTTGLVVSGLARGSSWIFRVRAVNAGGPGPWSDPSVPVVVPVTRPGPVTSLVGTAGASQVVLSWEAPADDGGTPITGYKVVLSADGGPWALVTSSTGSQAPGYTVAGLVSGTSYRFLVQTRNAIGVSPAAITNPAITPTPSTIAGAPTDVAGVAGPGAREVSLSWVAPGDAGGSPLTGFEVEKSLAGGTPVWTSGGLASGTDTGLLVSGLAAGESYLFRVRAVNAGGPGPWSDPSVTVVVPVTRPGPVTSLVGTAGASQVVLSWEAPADDGGTPITGYKVVLSADGGPWALVTSSTGSQAPGYTVAGLVSGTSYRFLVQTRNAIGVSPAVITNPAIKPL